MVGQRHIPNTTTTQTYQVPTTTTTWAIATLLRAAQFSNAAQRIHLNQPEEENVRASLDRTRGTPLRKRPTRRTQKGQLQTSHEEAYLGSVPNRQRRRLDEEEATTTTDDASERCSCSPTEYNFILNLEQDCNVNQLEGSPGIDLTFCLLGTHDGDIFGNRQRRLGGTNERRRLPKNENDEWEDDKEGRHVKIDFDEKVTLVDKRQLDKDNIEIISIQFLEFDTSGKLIVLNQDDTYADTSLTNGDIATFKSISRDLDPALPIEDQLNLLPGGVQVTLRAKSVDQATGEEKIVSNRITWSYTNGCDEVPLNEGMGIGWTTIGDLTPASAAFCPAAVIPTDAPTTAAPTPTPVEMCSFCPDGVDDPDYLLPTEDGATCGVAKAFADTLASDDDMCQLTKLAETLCCPPKPPTTSPVEMCSFCSNGFDDDVDDIIVDFLLPTMDGATCVTAKDFADALATDDDMCQTTKLAETLCCPPKQPTTSPSDIVGTASPTPAPVEMCEFCPNGLDDPDLLLPTEDGATCGTAKDFAATIAADNDFCATVKLAESLCCPPKPDTPSPTPEPTEESTPSFPPTTEAEAPPETTEAPPTETTPVPSETTEAPPVTTEAPPGTTEAPPATTTEAPMSMPDTTIIATEAPPMSMPIFAGKSKAAKACSSADGVSKSSKCTSAKSKTKKNPTKTKTHKGFYPMDPMSKVAKEDGDYPVKKDSSKGGKAGVDSSKGGKGAEHLDDSKSGKALVDMDAKAEKLTKTTKSAKADSSGKAAKSKASKMVKSAKADSGKAAKKLFHKADKDAMMSL